MAKKATKAAARTTTVGGGPAVSPKHPSEKPKIVAATGDMRADGLWTKEIHERLRKLKGNLKKAQADEEDLKKARRSIEAEMKEDDSDVLKVQWFDNRAAIERARASQKWLTQQILATIEGADQGMLFKGEPVKPTDAMLFGMTEEDEADTDKKEPAKG